MKRSRNLRNLELLVVAGCLVCGTAGADVMKVAENAAPAQAEHGTVLRDRCNVRARPDMTAEIVVQLNKGDEVDVLEHKTVSAGGKTMEWLRINLPASAKCYVNAKFVKDGAVMGESLNVRCGPGSNFKDIGKLAKGEHVEVVETKGEWLQIKPTDKCTGWISAELVEVKPTPAAPAPVPSARIEVVTPPVAVSLAPAPAAPEIRIVDTDPDVRVQYVVKDGVLRAVRDAARAPGSYELKTPEVDRLTYIIAYLETPQMNLSRYEDKNVRVFGTQRWRKGERIPVIAVDRVDMIW